MILAWLRWATVRVERRNKTCLYVVERDRLTGKYRARHVAVRSYQPTAATPVHPTDQAEVVE